MFNVNYYGAIRLQLEKTNDFKEQIMYKLLQWKTTQGTKKNMKRNSNKM